MKLIIDIPEDYYEALRKTDMIFNNGRCNGKTLMSVVYDAVAKGTPLPKGHSRKFKGIVVEYPPAELCTYPEYIGKPYFSIKYEENGEHFIGFGTYKPEVLSEYLREYFMISTIIEKNSEMLKND